MDGVMIRNWGLIAGWVGAMLCGCAQSTDVWQRKADEMKAAVLASPNPDPASFTGTCYYVSLDGSDDNDGKSPERPIASLKKVGTLNLKPGDAVLFRRGDLYRHDYRIEDGKLGGAIVTQDGVTYSAWGEGDKPIVCGSVRNYADPELWQETSHPGIWKCTLPLRNVGLITFDHDPRTVGKYDAICGTLVPPVLDMGPRGNFDFKCEPPLQLRNDLEFWTDDDAKCLYLRSAENPGRRFKRIEIAPDTYGLRVLGKKGVVIDNLHVTLFGRHGVNGQSDVYDLEVKNCIFDYIGGSILWKKWRDRYNVRFGNAVEVYGSCHGYKVHDNWIYQIYDTGVTHQASYKAATEIIHENVEYRNNLIEYCFWSIEYYNMFNKYGITRNIHVHDNFCRFGGEGWGCPLRKEVTPMYSFVHHADETSNYRTENNIFQFSEGYIISHNKEPEPEGCLSFRGNTYIQKSGHKFARWSGKEIPAEKAAVEEFLNNVLHETDYHLFIVDEAK